MKKYHMRNINGIDADESGTVTIAIPLQVLESIDEGNGVGIIIKGRDSAKYGSIGLDAIDFGSSSLFDNSVGAVGNYSVVSGGLNNSSWDTYTTVGGGLDNHADQYGSVIAGGMNNKTNGYASTVTGGKNNIAYAQYSTINGGSDNKTNAFYTNVSGQGNTANSDWEWIGGAFGTAPARVSQDAWDARDRIFNVGNGTSSVDTGDAFTILKNGLATLPSVTNDLISAELTGKAVVTKEYLATVNGNYVDDVAAASGGVSVGQMYHTAGVVKIRLS